MLNFDYSSHIVYIPDGYVQDINALQDDFFSWLYDQADCIVVAGKHPGVSYDANTFLRFVNDEVLVNSREKAYIVPHVKQAKKKIPKLNF